MAALYARFEKPRRAFKSTIVGNLTFTIENRSSDPVDLNIDYLSTAIFAVDVFDVHGQRKLTIPPGVPRPDQPMRKEALAPGAKRKFTISLHVFSPPLPPGSYTARVKAGNLESETVTFTIAR